MDICASYWMDLTTDYVRLVPGGNVVRHPWGSPVFPTIQEAIDAAQDDDLLALGPGVYREQVRFAGKAIVIQSASDAAILEAPGEVAVSFGQDDASGCLLRNVIIRNSLIGILVACGSPTITNVTVVGNEVGVQALAGASPCISDSILWANAQDDLDGCEARYSCIGRADEGEGNFSIDPLFVNPESGDYHVRSERGRYWASHDLWVLDDLTSPCVDAGDPTADFSREPVPNGGRLNVGAHGGTAFAAMSEMPVNVDMDADGVIDVSDLELFLDLWEYYAAPGPSVCR